MGWTWIVGERVEGGSAYDNVKGGMAIEMEERVGSSARGKGWIGGKGGTGRVRRDVSVALRIATKRGFWGVGRLTSMVVP